MAKKMKKLLALVLTIAMVLSFMSVGAFAAEGEGSEGTEPESAATYTVTYEYEDEVPEGAPAVPETVSYAEGAEVTVADDPTLDGYTFSGWSRTGTFTMPAEAVIITGSWTENEPVPQTTTYTVTVQYVDANGNEIAGSYVTEPAEGGSYDVTAYDQITIEGYTYSATSGDALSGTLDGNKVITVTYTKIPVKEALDLTSATEDVAAEDNTWAWEAATLTLTLNDATIDSSKDDVPAPAIKLPDGATIVVNGVNTIHASDDQNGIICAGALIIQGNGTLNVSCYDAVYASSISITGVTLNISGYRYGIYAYNGDSNASSVVLTNCTGICQATYYSGICAYSASGDAYVKLDNCDNLTVKSNGNNPNSGSVNHYYSGIRVYNVGATADATLEIVNCDNLYVSGSQDGMLVDAHANGQTTASGQAAVTITNSSVTAESATTVYSAIFVNNYGDTTDATSTITIQNSTVDGLAPNSVGIMTSTKNAASTVNVIDSTVAVSGKGAGVRMISKDGQYSSAAMSENSLLVVLTEVSAGAIDDTNGENAAKDGYTLNDTSKIVTATEGSITANGDGTFAIAKGSEVTAEYDAESVGYTFYMQAGGIGGNGYADREIWGYDTFSEKNWTADEIIIYNEDELHEFALITQGKHPVEHQRDFAGQTVKLGANIALTDYWYHRNAQGTIVTDYRISDFDGAFDGCDYTISNMKYLDEYAAATEEVPLSLFIEMDGTMENLTLDGVTVNTVAPTRFGALINDYSYQLDGTYVKDCTVKNISLTGKTGSKLVFGGMFWKILGSPEIEDCHVENLTVNTDGALSGTSTGRCGGFFATGGEGGSLIKNCSVKNFVVNTSSVINYVGGFAGGTSGMTYEDCEVDGFSVNMENKAKTHRTVGGFIGYTEGNGWDEPLVIKNCHVKDLDLDLGVSSTSTDKKGDAGFIGLFNNTTAGITIEDCSAAGSIKVDGDMTVGGFLGQPYKAPKNVEIKNCTTSVNVTTNGSAGGFVGSYAPLNANTITYTNCTATGDVFGKESVGSFLDADETTVDGIIGGTYNYDPENVDTETGETNNVADGYRALDNGDGTWTVFPDNGKEVVKVAFHRWNDKLNDYENWRTVEVFKDVDFSEDDYDNALNYSHPDYRFSNGIAELDEEADDKTEQVFGFWTDVPGSTKLVLDNEIEVLSDMNVYAAYGDFVCEIVETGVKYETLTAAVAAANASEGADTIKMLKSIDFDSTKALSITGDVTIIGEYTISRGAYTGTFFTVPAGSSLTLDGGLVFDGNNDWAFNKELYEYNLMNLVTGTAWSDYVTPEDGAPVASAAMFVVKGSVIAKDVTVQNNYSLNDSRTIFSVTGADATLTMEGTKVTHSAVQGANSVVYLKDAKWYIKDGTDISGNFAGRNGGVCRNDGGQIYMSGGTIKDNAAHNTNGTVFMMYGTGSLFEMTGGEICGNSGVGGTSNGRCAAIYLHTAARMHMTGGTICHNIGGARGGIDSYQTNSVLDVNRVDQHFDDPDWAESFEAAYTASNHPQIIDNISLTKNAMNDVGCTYDEDLYDWWVTGGIYTQDVDEFCAKGYVCIPYNDSERTDDYIVVPGYRVSYYKVETQTVTNAETGEEQTETVTTLIHKEVLPLPRDKFYYEVTLYAAPYYYLDSENGIIIKDWYTDVAMTEQYDFGAGVTGDIDLYGAWEDVSTYTVTYVDYYGTVLQTLTANTGDAVPEYSGRMRPIRLPDRNYYYTFSGWNLSEGTLGADGKVGITDLVYTASFDPHEIEDIFTPFFPTGDDDDTGNNNTIIDDEPVALAGVPAAFREDHIAYIIGRDDGLVHPEANITRAEVAMIFYRLLNDETRELYTTTESYFPDVTENDWYCAAVSTLNAMGIIYGKPDGTFDPNAYITRAEFAAIAARFDPTASTEGGFFTDIDGHWAELEINMAANNGWVEGFNGLFRPDENITRAEAMTMVNRVLLRVPESVEDLLDGMIVWADNMDPNKWYYLAVQEATNSHDYERKENNYEYWTALNNTED